MTDKKFTDAEVIKAIGYCADESKLGCPDDCPFSEECDENVFSLDKAIVDLINRRNAEIERLQAMVDAELDTIHDLGDDYERVLEEENELVKTAKTEAIKEFEKKFERKIKDVNFTLGQTWEIQNALKDTLKEMTE